MACVFFLLIMSISLNVDTLQALISPSITTATVAEDPSLSRTISRRKHPLPPVALPGILKDFDPLAPTRKRNELLTELRFLKNNILPMEKPLMRRRRAALAATSHPLYQMLALVGSRKNRDLRRLRRDLGYSSKNFEVLDDFTHPAYVIPSKPRLLNPQYQRPTEPVQTPELSRLLRGLDFLEQLALLTQEREIPPLVDADQIHSLHAPPSRFAPQPKLFEDDDGVENFPQTKVMRNVSPLGWNNPNRRDQYLWRPEKRWSGSKAWKGVSMVPGLKRSVFRESAMERLVPYKFGLERGSMQSRPKSMKSVSSLAAILAARMDPEENRIRRAAM